MEICNRQRKKVETNLGKKSPGPQHHLVPLQDKATSLDIELAEFMAVKNTTIKVGLKRNISKWFLKCSENRKCIS